MHLQIKFKNIVRAVFTNFEPKATLYVFVLDNFVSAYPLGTARIQTLYQFKLATFFMSL